MSVTMRLEGYGCLKFELHCEMVPRTCKNFLALLASGYYADTEFHRNVKGFILQGGDPTGSGKGGESIYGEPFEDEFRMELRHDRRGVLSMANAGKNRNTS